MSEPVELEEAWTWRHGMIWKPRIGDLVVVIKNDLEGSQSRLVGQIVSIKGCGIVDVKFEFPKPTNYTGFCDFWPIELRLANDEEIAKWVASRLRQ